MEIKNWNKVFNILQKYKKRVIIIGVGISLAKSLFLKKIMNKFDFIRMVNLLVAPYTNE